MDPHCLFQTSSRELFSVVSQVFHFYTKRSIYIWVLTFLSTAYGCNVQHINLYMRNILSLWTISVIPWLTFSWWLKILVAVGTCRLNEGVNNLIRIQMWGPSHMGIKCVPSEHKAGFHHFTHANVTIRLQLLSVIILFKQYSKPDLSVYKLVNNYN